MKRFCSESISECDKLTIRAYKNNFSVKLSSTTLHNELDVQLPFLPYHHTIRNMDLRQKDALSDVG